MIIKEFKHKETGKIFVQNPLFNRWYTDKSGGDALIPPYIVELSADWEEVKVWNFKTFDEKYLVLGQTMYAIYQRDLSDYGRVLVTEGMLDLNVLLYFSSIEARDLYLAENNTLFSVKEIIQYLRDETYVDSCTKDISDFPALKRLALDKLHKK